MIVYTKIVANLESKPNLKLVLERRGISVYLATKYRIRKIFTGNPV